MIDANNPLQLKRLAGSIVASVQPRGEGRTTKQVEKWSVRSLLLALADTHHIKYPVKAVMADKPDLEIIFGQDKVAVEITEAVPEDYARAIVLAKRKYPDAFVERSLFRWNSPRKTNAELHKILEQSKNKLMGPGWDGDSVECEWAEGIVDTISKKLRIINRVDYRFFPRYWLAIYDNLRGPALNLKLGVKYLRKSFPDQRICTRHFQYIFIEVGGTLVAISSGGQLRYFEFKPY